MSLFVKGCGRRAAWRRARANHEPAEGEGATPAFLAERARAIDTRASSVARRRIDVHYSPPQLGAYERTDPGDRAWRCVRAAGEWWWCVIDAHAQSAILDIAVGGSGSRTPTPAERTIVAEFVERVLAFGSEPPPFEEADARPTGRDAWRCNVDLTAAQAGTATLQLFATPAASVPARGVRPDPTLVPLDLEAVMPPVRMPLSRVLDWRPGSLVVFGPQAQAKYLLVAGNRRVAVGELGLSKIGWSMRIASVEGCRQR